MREWSFYRLQERKERVSFAVTRDVTQHLLNAKIVPFVSSQTRIHSQDGLTDFTDFLSSPPSPFSVYDTQACVLLVRSGV